MTTPRPRFPVTPFNRPARPALPAQVELQELCDDTAVLVGSGEIDLATVPLLCDAISTALAGGSRRMVLELSRVSFFGVAGLVALRDAGATDVAMAVVASRHVQRALDVATLPSPIATYGSLAEALRALEAPRTHPVPTDIAAESLAS